MSEVFFEALHLRTGGNPIGAQRVDDFADFFFSD